MATPLDNILPGTVYRLLATYGVPAVFKRAGTGIYNPATGEGSFDAGSYTVKISPPAPFDSKFVDERLIQAGDAMAYIAAQNMPTGFSPKAGMVMEFAGETWQVVLVKPLYSGTLIAAYMVQLRH